MINVDFFFNSLRQNNIDFFCGVPDSLLKNICAKITDELDEKSHIITANEGAAVALATGYHFATGEIPLVYMQNSGFGNTINPLTSLAAPEVYGVPMILLIGWRGEPGIKDEPQHMKKGAITLSLLETMKIPYQIIPDENEAAEKVIKSSIKTAQQGNTPVALVVRKNLFDKYKLKSIKKDKSDLTREAAIKTILEQTQHEDAIYLGSTGKIGRELYEVRQTLAQSGEKDFLNVGSMGHTSQIALGIAMHTEKKVFCLDGDGAMIMHMGGLTSIGDLASKNFIHVVLNNFAHDSVGGQPTLADKIDFGRIAKACGYKKSIKVTTIFELESIFDDNLDGPILIEVLVKKGARDNLGRPKESPAENKEKLMHYLKR